MKQVLCVVSGIVLMASVSFAQGPGGGAPAGIAVGLQRAYAALKTNLTQSAEKMSDADYSFKPTNEIRGYGQLWGHVANAQFGQCARPRAFRTRTWASIWKQDDEGGVREGARRLVRLLRRRVFVADRCDSAEMLTADAADRPRGRGAARRHRPRQRDVRHRDRVSAAEGAGAAVDRKPGPPRRWRGEAAARWARVVSHARVRPIPLPRSASTRSVLLPPAGRAARAADFWDARPDSRVSAQRAHVGAAARAGRRVGA